MIQFTSLAQLERQLQLHEQTWTHNYKLNRMQQAVARLGHPELNYKVVHIGGTSGKGSTCQMVYSILRSAGFKVGIFTSPHLVHSLERIVINDCSITTTAFLRYVNQVWLKVIDLRLTYFEFYTLMSLVCFARRKVDYAVIEVGLGGRLDATNIVTPTVAVVTDIGLDHTEVLGKTKRAIAKEKEAIIKPGCIGFTGSKFVHRGRYIELTAAKLQTTDLTGTVFHYKAHKKIKLNLVGAYQVRNASLAIEVATALHIAKRAIYHGLQHVHSRARFQIVSRQPLIIMDGAHNPQKMAAFVRSLRQVIHLKQYRRVTVLFALKYNKDARATLRPIVKLADTVIITSFRQAMPLRTLRELVQELKPGVQTIVQKHSSQAYCLLQQSLAQHDLGIITGSLYMIGDLLQIFSKRSSFPPFTKT